MTDVTDVTDVTDRPLLRDRGARGLAWRRLGARALALAGLILALVALLAPRPTGARPARAKAPALAVDDLAGLISQPVVVHFPVAIDGDAPVPAALRDLKTPTSTPALPIVQGPVTVAPGRAALVRAPSLAVLRLRAPAATGAIRPPRLRRLQGEAGGSWLAIDEAAIEVSPGTWLIEQPPGGPGYWLVSAEAPLELVIEAVEARRADLIWEDRSDAILAWIDGGGELPPLPEVAGEARLRRALLADAAIAAALERRNPGDRPFLRAVRAWRRAAALQHLAVARDLRRSAFGVELRPRALAGTAPLPGAGRRSAAWRRRDGDGRWTLELSGPGLLVVDARLLGAGPDGAIEVVRGGRRLGRADLLSAQTGPMAQVAADRSIAAAGDGGAPAGITGEDDGDGDEDDDAVVDGDDDAGAAEAPKGPRGQIRVPLAPGRHAYELRFRGHEGALRVRIGHENPRFAAVLRGETVPAALRRARRALGRSRSGDAALVADLLAEVAGEAPPGSGAKSRNASKATSKATPVAGEAPSGSGAKSRNATPKAAPGADDARTLALAADLLRAREADLPAAERRRRARALARAADAAAGSPLAWEARAAGIDLLAGLYAPSLVRALAGPEPQAAPASVLHRLARAIEGPPLLARSPALALLGRARRLRPLDPGVRDVFRERWRGGTRWSTLRADDEAGAPWLWIEPRATAGGHAPTSSDLWIWPVGQARAIAAPPSPVDPSHPALLRIYAGTDAPAAPLALTVDGQRWHTRALGPLQALSVALPPGEHRAAIAAPAGARIFASLPPAPGRPADARLLRMWPAARGEALRFFLPGGDLPGFVRLELRGVAPALPARVRVQVQSDVGEPRELDLDLVADPGIVAADAPAAAGARVVVVLPIEPKARVLTLRLVDGAPVIAAAVALRTTRGSDPPAPTPSRSAPRPPRDEAALLAEVAAASRGLEDDPGDRHLRIKRATALLELDQRGLALADWDRIVAGELPPALLPEILALAARLDAHDAPTHIDLRTEAPVLVEPALAAVVGDDPGRLDAAVPAITAAWRRGPEAGLRALGVDPGALATEVEAGARTAAEGGKAPGLGSKRVFAQRAEGGDGLADRTGLADGERERSARDRLADQTGLADGKSARDRLADRPGAEVADSLSRGTGDPIADVADLADLAGDPIAGALAATWLADAGRPRASALLWARVGARSEVWQADLAAVDGFLAALDRAGSPAGAGLAHGVALGLLPSVHTPQVRRLRAVTAARSRWARILGAEQGGGAERLHVPLASTLPAPSVAVQRALMTPPWPHTAGVHLSPGYATVIELRRSSPRAIAVDLWCQALRPDLGDGAPARVQVHVDGRARHDGPIADDELVTIAGGTLAPGGHRVEVELAAESRAHRCAARVREQSGKDDAVGSRRPTRWWVARPDAAVELVIAGPTTIAIEARAELPGGARSVTLSLGRGDDGVRDLGVIDLPQVADPDADPELSRSIHPGIEAIRVIPVVDPGPHRLRISAAGGPALVRVLGRADGGAPPPSRGSQRTLTLGALAQDAEAAPLPALADPRIAPAPTMGRVGTFTADLRVGNDDLEDADDLRSRPGATLRLGYARELLPRRLWIGAHGELRPRQATAITGGGGLSIQGVIPRAGLRVGVGGLALTQAYGDGQAWSLRGHLHVDRPTWIAPRLQLLPRLDVLGRLQSLSRESRDRDVPVHPRVYQRYVDDHPLVVLPGLDLRIQPWRDARVIVGAEAAPNSDFRSLDHVSTQVGFYGALALKRPVVPEFWVEEQLSYRLRDADRSQAFLRSRFRVGVGVGFWATRSARIVIGGANTLYTSTRFPLRNIVEAWLRVDLVFGRGLRDLGPLGVAFRPIRERRLWNEGGTP